MAILTIHYGNLESTPGQSDAWLHVGPFTGSCMPVTDLDEILRLPYSPTRQFGIEVVSAGEPAVDILRNIHISQDTANLIGSDELNSKYWHGATLLDENPVEFYGELVDVTHSIRSAAYGLHFPSHNFLGFVVVSSQSELIKCNGFLAPETLASLN